MAEIGLGLVVLTVERVREDEVVAEAAKEEEEEEEEEEEGGLVLVMVEEEEGIEAVALAATGAKLFLWFRDAA